MADYIKDGAGSGVLAKVNANQRLYVQSVSMTEEKAATKRGESYTTASGVVVLTSAGVSGILYMKNNEIKPVHINQIVVSLGPSTGGDATDTNLIKVMRNPTEGTLVSTADDSPIKCNRNFGSNRDLVADAYVGAEGLTITDGVVHSQVLMADNTVRDLAIDETLSPGSTIAISVEPMDSNTNMKVTVEILCNVEDTRG